MALNQIQTLQSPYRLIHDLYVLLDYGDTLVLSEFDFSSTQFRIFSLLDISEGIRLTTLSNRVLRSKSQVTRVIDQLEERKLITRITDPSDRRAQSVRLTEEGFALRETISQTLRESLEDRFSVLSVEEQEVFTHLTDKLRLGMLDHFQLE